MARHPAPKKLKPWERSRARASSGERKVDTRETFRSFLIVCEGTETEPNYFKAFRAVVRSSDIKADIKVRGLGKDPKTLVHKTKGIREHEEARRGGAFDEIWCVFDLDDFGDTFTQAIREAKAAGFEVAFSNPCVELWFLLHFRDQKEALTRDQLKQMLTAHLKREYSKTDPDLFSLVWQHREKAFQRATALLNSYAGRPGGFNPAAHNPCTRVHELIKALSVNLTDLH